MEELAQVMSVLSETEQSELVGGTYVYDSSGNLVYENKDSGHTMLIVTDMGKLYELKAGCMNFDTFKDTACKKFSEVSYDTRKNVIETIAQNLDVSLNVSSHNLHSGFSSERSNGTTDSKGNITINADGSVYLLEGNQMDIQMTIQHELYHKNDSTPKTSNYNMLKRDYEAYMHVFDHPDFPLCSPSYQEGVRQRLDEINEILKKY